MAEPKQAAYEATAAVPFVGSAAGVRPHAKLIGLLALGHFVIDVTQGSLPAVLPFLKQMHALTYAQVAMIVLAGNLTSSIIQPLFGYLSDQIARRWILPVSVFVAGAGIALVGRTPGYGAVLALVVVMGLGVAAWHPEGYRTATMVAGDRKATALSWFSLGGNVGVTLGLFGAILTASFSVSVVLGQAYLPRNAGMASGLIVGFAIGLGGAGVTGLGRVADHWGVPAALWISALMPLAAFGLTRLLPAPRDAAA